MTYFFYLIFALAPSIIWLLFFLRKDAHPESNRMILKIFFYGMLSTLPIISFWILMETLGFSKIISEFLFSSIYIRILYIFIGIALVEEILKYLVVKEKVLSDPEFDEPVDVMLYMIIAALGFAALENILILFPFSLPAGQAGFPFFEAFLLSGFRFLGATFLHALCSGMLGYFLALSFFETKSRFKLSVMGLGIVIFLHGLYNFSIMEIGGNLRFIIPIIILISLAFAVLIGFKKVKKMASVCKIK